MSPPLTDPTPDPGRDAPQLFISYNSRDHQQVAVVREQLSARGISSFFDREHLIKGLPWPQALEHALTQAAAVAVFLGPHGLGRWQKREMGFALEHQVQQEERTGMPSPVIPVLLPDRSDPTAGFLFLNTWVDLRQDLRNPQEIEGIVRAIGGEMSQGQPGVSRIDLLPYRGLEVFREQDAAFFHGREAFTERLFEAGRRRNLVAVVGPSGSGKSSLVQVGHYLSYAGRGRWTRPGTRLSLLRASVPTTAWPPPCCRCWSPISARPIRRSRPPSSARPWPGATPTRSP